MQVYKTFFKMLLRNLTAGLLYLGIFIGITFSVVHSNSQYDVFSATKINIAVIDRDNSSLSKALYDYLDENQKIVSIDANEDKWADELFYRTTDYILVIENGFESRVSDGTYQNLLTSYSAPDSNTAYIAESQIESYMQNISYYVEAGCDFDEAASNAARISQLSADVKYPDNTETGNTVKPAHYFFTFLPYILICMLINSLGTTLIIWNRPEIKSRTAVSSTSLKSRNMGFTAAMAIYSLVIIGIFLLVYIIIYRNDFFTQSSIYYILNSLCYLMVCLAITFLVSQLSKRVSTLAMWSNGIGLSTSFLCGVFVSRELLPDKVVSFSKCLPTYWYINVTEELKNFSGSISALAWRSMGIQLLFAVAILSIALVIIKSRQQKNA